MHSRAGNQENNDHWKERLSERVNDQNEMNFGLILNDLKTIMNKYPENIEKSTKNENRFRVIGKFGIQFILEK